MFITLASRKVFFIVVAHVLSMLCQLMFRLAYNGKNENRHLLLIATCIVNKLYKGK